MDFSNPEIKDWATNWDENFDKAIKYITDSVMAEKDGNEFFKKEYSELIKRIKNLEKNASYSAKISLTSIRTRLLIALALYLRK